MELNDIHIDIRNFIEDLSDANVKIHNIGLVKSFTFKKQKLTVYYTSDKFSPYIIFESKYYPESDFLRFLKLKVYW